MEFGCKVTSENLSTRDLNFAIDITKLNRLQIRAKPVYITDFPALGQWHSTNR
jgi:hypothetical protein